MTSAWFNWDEWKITQIGVIDTLQNPSKEKIEAVLNTLSVWHGRQIVPVQIEATIGVLNSIYSKLTSPNFFVAIAGFTIVRFVDGMVDAPQKAGSKHKSVYQMAVELGIPTSLVEARHSITHGASPSSQELIEFIRIISEYLVINYWQQGSQESTRAWLNSFIESVKTNNRLIIDKCILEGKKNITSSSLFELSHLIVQNGCLEGNESKWWKQMIIKICNRRGFNDIMAVGATKEFCKEFNKSTELIENWIIFCISTLGSGVEEIINILKTEGILFEEKTQKLLKRIALNVTDDMKNIVGGFILRENLKLKEMECEEVEQFIDQTIKKNQGMVGNWMKLGQIPDIFVSNENLIIESNTPLMIVN